MENKAYIGNNKYMMPCIHNKQTSCADECCSFSFLCLQCGLARAKQTKGKTTTFKLQCRHHYHQDDGDYMNMNMNMNMNTIIIWIIIIMVVWFQYLFVVFGLIIL